MTGFPHVVLTLKCEDLGSELLVYDEGRDAYHLLNSTARLVWELCDGSRSAEQIADEVARVYPAIPDEQIRIDVARTLEVFLASEIVTLAAERSGSA